MKLVFGITSPAFRSCFSRVGIFQLMRAFSYRNLCTTTALCVFALSIQQSMAADNGGGSGEGDGDATECSGGGGCGGGAEGGEPNDQGDGEVCNAESECEDCGKGETGEPLEESDGPKGLFPVNWETGEKWETISDLVVAVNGADFRLTRQYSSDPAYTNGGLYSGRYSSTAGNITTDVTVGAHWAFSNLRAFSMREIWGCESTECSGPLGTFGTTVAAYYGNLYAVYRPGRKPREFVSDGSDPVLGQSYSTMPGNQRVRIKNDGEFEKTGPTFQCGNDICGYSSIPGGFISGTVIFEDPGEWSQEFKLVDSIGFIQDEYDEFGNRKHYVQRGDGLPEFIRLNGGGINGGNLTWGDDDMAEAEVRLFWETIDIKTSPTTTRTQTVLVRAEVWRPTPTVAVLTQIVEYYHLVDDGSGGLEVKFHDGTSYDAVVDPATSSTLIPSGDLGTAGDLVQVVRYRVIVPGATTPVFRVQAQQYRYHDGSGAPDEDDIRLETQGEIHQLKMSIAPQQIEFLAQQLSTETSPTDTTMLDEALSLMALDDDDQVVQVGGSWVHMYEGAEKIITYTGAGASPVEHQFLQATSCGCGSLGTQSGVLLSYEQFDWDYEFLPSGPGSDEVPGKSMHIKEFALASFAAWPATTQDRTYCYDLLMLGDGNEFPYKWVTATVEGDGTGTDDRAWVSRTNYDRDERIVTGRNTPSVFDSYTMAGASAVDSPPAFVLNAGDGLVTLYNYANENVGDTLYRPNGGTPELITKKIFYSDVDADIEAVREFLPIKESYYRVAGTTDPDEIETVEYEYGWENPTLPDAKRDWTRIIEERELVGENGPTSSGDPNTVSHWEFYDNQGMIIWEVDPDGVLTRYEYDPVHGNLVKVVQNSQAPDELTLPSSELDPLYATLDEWVEPATDNPIPSPTGSDGGLVTEYKRDVLGRLTQIVYPGGVTRTIVREMIEDSGRPGVLYFAKTYLPHLASGPSVSPKVYSGPVERRIMDAANKTIRRSGYELDVTGTYAPETVTNTSSILGDEISRSTNSHNLSGSATLSTTWWDVSADESYSVSSEYDTFGRLVKVTDGNDTVSERSYDAMDRVIEVKVGTTTSTPETIVEYIYDSASATTMAQGVGNGNMTGVILHDGDSGTRVSRIYYDYRDRQIGVVVPDAPMDVTLYDNLDRPIESAVYPDPDAIVPSIAEVRSVASRATLPSTDASIPWLDGVYRAMYTKVNYSQRGLVWSEWTSIDPIYTNNFLEWNAWYDDDGNEIASWGPNSPKVVSEYDTLDRVTKLMVTDRAGDVSALSYAGAIDVSDDNVLEQAEYSYASGSGLLEMVTSRMKVHDDTTLGTLTGTNSITTYMGYIYDEAQRVVGAVDFGTNKSTANPFSKSAGTLPMLANYNTLDKLRSATGVLFGWRTYNSRGMIEDFVSIQEGTSATDEIRSRYLYDDMYRTIGTVENADAISDLAWDNTEQRYTVSGFDHTKLDTDRVTSFAYDAMSNIVKRVAHIPTDSGGGTSEDVQVTEYVYGVTDGTSTNPMDSLLASNNILSEVRYPDESTGEASSASTSRVQYAFNRLGELRGVTDQNGTLRTFGRDQQGRMTYDKVDTLGAYMIDGVSRAVDGAVRRIGYTYDSLGRMSSVASFTDAAGTTYRDEVQMGYTSLWQIETVTQQHDGAVDSSSAQVSYRYESLKPTAGDKNYTRLTDIVYPTDNSGSGSDQTVQYTYATGVDDRLSRLNSIGVEKFNQPGGGSDIQELISYTRIGLGLMAQSKLNWNNTPGGTSAIDYITLDRTVEHDGTLTAGTYPAMDRFGRVTNHMWVPEGFATGTGGFSNIPAVVEIGHSYDRSSNRLSYTDAREGARLPGRDRAFVYDRLNRLIEESRSPLPASSGYTSQHSGHQWALDMLGNWDSVTNDADHDGVFTDNEGVGYLDDRAANSANEIDDSGSAQYDRRLLESGTTPVYFDYHYDDSGNLTDERTGNTLPVSPGTLQNGRQHSYDAWNRLVKSEMRATGGTVMNTIAEYTYNGLGWRTTKKMDTATGAYDGTLDQERTFYYGASWRILEEHVDSDLSSSSDDVWISQEFWGARYIDDSIAKRIDRGGSGNWSGFNSDLTHWFRLSDSQFSVVAVLNEFGVVHERVSYDAYGDAKHRFGGDASGDGSFTTADLSLGSYPSLIGSSGYNADLDFNNDGAYNGSDLSVLSTSAWTVTMNDLLPEGWVSDPEDTDGPDNSIGYAGYVFNAEREDYSVRFRVYSPELGRWMQRDPIGYADGSNRYGYSSFSPIIYNDPSGLLSQACRRVCRISNAIAKDCPSLAMRLHNAANANSGPMQPHQGAGSTNAGKSGLSSLVSTGNAATVGGTAGGLYGAATGFSSGSSPLVKGFPRQVPWRSQAGRLSGLAKGTGTLLGAFSIGYDATGAVVSFANGNNDKGFEQSISAANSGVSIGAAALAGSAGIGAVGAGAIGAGVAVPVIVALALADALNKNWDSIEAMSNNSEANGRCNLLANELNKAAKKCGKGE